MAKNDRRTGAAATERIGETKMKVEELVEIIGSDFYTGVPDSQL